MWQFRIGCFVSLCGLLWIAAVASPFQDWQNSLTVVPVLVILAAAHIVVIMRYVDTTGAIFEKFWVGCLCGIVDAALTLVFLFIATMSLKLGLEGGFRKAIIIIAWCLAFGFPQLLSPRIVSVFLKRKPNEASQGPGEGVPREGNLN